MTKINKPPGVAGRAGEGSVEHMGEHKTLVLTIEQMSTLRLALVNAIKLGEREINASKEMAERTKEDGTPEFPNIKSIGEWWEKENAKIWEIISKL